MVEERLGIKLVDAFENDGAAALIHQNEFHSILTHALVHLALSDLAFKRHFSRCAHRFKFGRNYLALYFKCTYPRGSDVCHTGRCAMGRETFSLGKIRILEAGMELTKTLCSKCPVILEPFAEYGFSTNKVFCGAEDVEMVTSFLIHRGIKYKL